MSHISRLISIQIHLGLSQHLYPSDRWPGPAGRWYSPPITVFHHSHSHSLSRISVVVARPTECLLFAINRPNRTRPCSSSCFFVCFARRINGPHLVRLVRLVCRFLSFDSCRFMSVQPNNQSTGLWLNFRFFFALNCRTCPIIFFHHHHDQFFRHHHHGPHRNSSGAPAHLHLIINGQTHFECFFLPQHYYLAVLCLRLISLPQSLIVYQLIYWFCLLFFTDHSWHRIASFGFFNFSFFYKRFSLVNLQK